jgi:hypothetical protein
VRMKIPIYQPTQRPTNLYEFLIKEASVPVRGLFALVLVFTVGIGPVNIWLLSRFKRRIWLWWNVPAISLLTCLAVFAYASFSEGWTSHGKVASFTFLDERCHRATTIGYLSYYCPLTPSSGPRFGVDTDVAILESWQNQAGGMYHYRGDTSLRFVDWTKDQHLSSGWVNARVPAYFQIRKNEDRRERLIVKQQADGSMTVVNALGADIRRLYVADGSGRIFEGGEIAAGAEKLLTATEQINSGTEQNTLNAMFANTDWLSHFSQCIDVSGREDRSMPHGALGTELSHYALRRGYAAVLDKSPFVETPLEGVVSEDTAAIVCGKWKEADDGR